MKGNLIRLLAVVGSIGMLAACGRTVDGNSALVGNDSAIIGGSEVTAADDVSRSIVALLDVKMGELCTASIIASDMLITASHCVDGGDPTSLRVIFATNIDSNNRVVLGVVNAIQSPLWAQHSSDNTNTGDIALVHLAGKIPAGYVAAKILPDESALQNGMPVVLAGYGITDGVTKVGAGVLRQTTVSLANAQFSDTEALMNQTAGHGACHGDSGGPAYVVSGGQRYLFGVTARGVNDPKNDCTQYAAYTRILPYASWLKKAIPKLRAVNGTPAVGGGAAPSAVARN